METERMNTCYTFIAYLMVCWRHMASPKWQDLVRSTTKPGYITILACKIVWCQYPGPVTMMLRVHQMAKYRLVSISYIFWTFHQSDLVCCAAGGSGRLGTSGLDNALVISELTNALPRTSERLVSTHLNRRSPLAVRTALSMAAIDVSIVDHMPEELLMVYAANVHAISELNVGAAARFTRASVTVGHIQVMHAVCLVLIIASDPCF